MGLNGMSGGELQFLLLTSYFQYIAPLCACVPHSEAFGLMAHDTTQEEERPITMGHKRIDGTTYNNWVYENGVKAISINNNLKHLTMAILAQTCRMMCMDFQTE
jgi:hypothetical protein